MQKTSNKIEFSIIGRIPSKKNSRNLFARGNKLFNIPSKRYKEWHDIVSVQLREIIPEKPINNVESVYLAFYAPDKRATDLTNKAESIMDLLVDNKIIEDDNWFIVRKIELVFKGIDRKKPRCEICIYIKE
jgi:Holliday junction resolvase RusA-like endonuclease